MACTCRTDGLCLLATGWTKADAQSSVLVCTVRESAPRALKIKDRLKYFSIAAINVIHHQLLS